MSTPEYTYPYVAISGDIGVGKSTVGKIIADGLNYKFYREPPYWKNPFFLKEGKAYQSETHFLMKSFAVLLVARQQRLTAGVVVDVPPEQHANDYPRVLLDERELAQFQKMYKTLKESYGDRLMSPSLIVYLEATTAVILERIRKRGRLFEQNITVNDIEKHTELNHDWIAQSHLPALFIPTDNLDLIHRRQAREYMVARVREKLNSHV